jgi:hypothetical protein
VSGKIKGRFRRIRLPSFRRIGSDDQFPTAGAGNFLNHIGFSYAFLTLSQPLGE